MTAAPVPPTVAETPGMRRLAERGRVGMTIPTAYGGHGRSHLERFAVTGELHAVGAPVAARRVRGSLGGAAAAWLDARTR